MGEEVDAEMDESGYLVIAEKAGGRRGYCRENLLIRFDLVSRN
jgi:hypothetical protein